MDNHPRTFVMNTQIGVGQPDGVVLFCTAPAQRQWLSYIGIEQLQSLSRLELGSVFFHFSIFSHPILTRQSNWATPPATFLYFTTHLEDCLTIRDVCLDCWRLISRKKSQKKFNLNVFRAISLSGSDHLQFAYSPVEDRNSVVFRQSQARRWKPEVFFSFIGKDDCSNFVSTLMES